MQVACVYYYCFHARNQNEAGPFLRWVLAQLCRKSETVPRRVYDIFKLGRQPTLTQLLACLEAVLEYFERVLITIDAVDESQQRESLLAILADLATDPRYCKVQLLVTSREYVDIREIMSRISRSLSMSNPHVEADIERYAGIRLRATPKFRFWPPGLVSEVQHALAAGANGMFRWAVCQLDILRRLDDISKVRAALKDLPQTLDDTYIRIFSYIDENDWPLLRHTLRFICFHNAIYEWPSHPMDKIILSAYSAFGIHGRDRNADHLYTSQSLEEICGCLVTFRRSAHRPQARLSLAHYTVREFIESDRCSSTPAAYFYSQPGETTSAVFSSILRHAMTHAIDPDEAELYRSKSVIAMALEFIMLNLNAYCHTSAVIGLGALESLIVNDEEQMAVVFDFLNPMDPLFSQRSQPVAPFMFGRMAACHKSFEFWELGWISTTSNRDVDVLVNFLVGGYMTMAGATINSLLPSRLATAEMSVSFRYHDEKTRTLGRHQFSGTLIGFFAQCSRWLEWGALPVRLLFRRLLDQPGQPLIHPTVILANYAGPHDHGGCGEHADCECVLDWLLELGADANAKEYRVTPLQIAVANRDLHGVRSLLEAGADPNRVGNANGIQWSPASVSGHFFNDLHGSSPLYIIHNRESFNSKKVRVNELGQKVFDSELDKSEVEEEKEIKQLLLMKGAESVSVLESHGQ